MGANSTECKKCGEEYDQHGRFGACLPLDDVNVSTYDPPLAHDARITCEIPFGGPPIKRPYGWECLHCGAKGKRFATGEAAMSSAMEHNGGTYNHYVPDDEYEDAYRRVAQLRSEGE